MSKFKRSLLIGILAFVLVMIIVPGLVKAISDSQWNSLSTEEKWQYGAADKWGLLTSEQQKEVSHIQMNRIKQTGSNVNGSLHIRFSVMPERNDLYCAQYHAPLGSWQYYSIPHYYKITGNQVVDQNNNVISNNNINGVIAYIFNKKLGYGQGPGNYSAGQLAFYAKSGEWFRNIGRSDWVDSRNTQVGTNSEARNIINEGQNYANRIGNQTQVAVTGKDITNKNDIKVTEYVQGGKSWFRIGPFKWNFTGNVSSITLTGDNGKKYSNVNKDIWISVFNGSEEKYLKLNEMKSGQNFYLTIGSQDGVKAVKKVEAKISPNTDSDKLITAEVWLFNNSEKQRLVLTDAKEETIPPANITMDLNVQLTKNITIIKVDSDDNNKLLPNVGFILQNKENQKYIKIENGVASYVTNRDDATEKYTDVNGKVTFSNVPIGEYIAYETKNPNKGYLVTDDDKVIIPSSKKEITMGNRYKLGNLIIEKLDKEDPSQKLEGVEFTIKATSGSQEGKYVGINQETGKTEYYKDKVTVKTGSDGKIVLNDLWEGNYEIQEISNPNYGYLVQDEVITTSIVPRETIKEEITNKYYLGNLTIEKVDEQNQDIKLKDVEFTIKATSGEQAGKYVSSDANGNAVYSTDKVTIKTDINGQIKLEQVWEGNYEIQEISNPNYGYLVDSTLITVTIASREETTEVITNKYHLGDLEFEKVDADNHNYKLEGVEFAIQAITGEKAGQYVSINSNGEAVYSTNKVTVKTDDEGKVKITKLWEGEYELEEVNIPQYGYKLLDEKISVIVRPRETARPELDPIENKQIYVKLSGYVWLDQLEGKTTILNDLYDNEEPAYDGITVNLVDRNGNIIKTTTTKESGLYGEIDGGEYQFVDVLIEELDNYHIEFIYNGLKYQSVLPHIDVDNGSKAIDDTSRSKLNQAFQTVNGTGTQTVSTSAGIDIGYSNISREHASQVEDWNDEACEVTARTDDANYVIKDHFTAGTGQEEIRYINLGVKERPQADLAAAKDLEYVKLELNGYVHRYDYAKRFKEDIQDDAWDVGVKFKTDSEYGGMEYMRPIYKADAEYEDPNNPSNELQVYFRYKIALKNEASAYNARVNTVIDYYDSRYTLVGATDSEGNSLSVSSTQYDGNYNKAVITANTDLNSGDAKSIYVEFKLSREAVNTILKEGDENETLDNVVEINSYTSFERGTTNIVAAVDIDSVPGNAKPGNVDTYEDDTDHAPPVKLQYAQERKVEGTVFEDATTGELRTGETRQGDGKYDTASGDKGIANVTVQLAELNDDGTVKSIVKETTTDNAGNYQISEFIPGKYEIIYKWGGEEQDGKTYTVQDYKGTVYDKSRYEANSSNTYWYRNETDRYTDAVDNYETRLNIDKEVQQITNNTILDYENGNLMNKTMNSTTPIIEFGVEYASEQSDGTQNETQFIAGNMDFGIVERARQALSLKKQVSAFDVTLADGSQLIHGEFDNDGNLVVDSSSKYLTGGVDLGYVKAEMDTEILQGSTLRIGYKVNAYNNSEVDYKTREYYLFGIAGNASDMVTLAASGVVDYLDEDYTYNQDENAGEGWTEITAEQLQNYAPHCFIANENQGKQPSEIEELKGKRIMYTDKLQHTYMQPGQMASAGMNVSKTITTTDDIAFDNNAEIVQVNKTDNPNGSDIPDHVGGIVPELPESEAPEVQVVPSTGEDKNYIVPIAVGIVACVILGAGIIIIRKKVVK